MSMHREAGSIDLPDALIAWVEHAVRGRIESACAHFGGASRLAWSIDAHRAGERVPLFLLRDKGAGRGSVRDAAFLRALSGSAVPVPHVYALDEAGGLLLLERLPGSSDFPVQGAEDLNEATAAHLMKICAALHALDPSSLDLPAGSGGETQDSARASLRQIHETIDALGSDRDPLFAFALAWLERNVPTESARRVLVHSDLGPGNFLHREGRVTGLLDWEVAHQGDPMEDLAALAVRDMATPVGSLARRFYEYAEAGGAPVDLERVHYYRLLLLIRNSAMIGLGLAHPVEGFDVLEMTMYQTLLLRAAALVLCDAIGCERPTERDALGAAGATPSVSSVDALVSALERDVEQVILPELQTEGARQRALGLSRGLAALAHESRVGAFIDARESGDLAALLDRPGDPSATDTRRLSEAVRGLIAEESGLEHVIEPWAAYFARRMHRLAERRRPLMGPLMNRLPQLLEDT